MQAHIPQNFLIPTWRQQKLKVIVNTVKAEVIRLVKKGHWAEC